MPLILLPLGCVELLLYVIRNVIVGFLCILSLHMQNQGLQLARLERVVLLLFGSCQQYGPRGQGGPGHRIISFTHLSMREAVLSPLAPCQSRRLAQ
jgi:hypothetical protein